MKGRLPDFVIAGAPRSGTTSLARYLDAHPSVFVAPGKELRFFDDNYDKGIEWYSARFDSAPGDSVAGEASPWYMFDPVSLGRMARHIPDARVIVSFREPCDRLWSHYWMRHERGLEKRSFEAALASEFQTFEQHGELSTELFYLRGSLYAPHLRSVLRHFPSERVQVLILEQMAKNPDVTFSTLCSALGIDEGFRPDNLGDAVNAYSRFRSLRIRNLAKSSDSRLAKRIVGRLNQRSAVSYPDLRPEQRELLAKFFSPFNLDLETLLGRTILEWRGQSG